MSIKTTQRITRDAAIALLTTEIQRLPNDTLGNVLDLIADSGRSFSLSRFDNFIVSDMPEVSRP